MNALPHVSIIGAGLMGSGIAHAFASHGCAVTLCDLSQHALDAARKAISASSSAMEDAGLLTSAQATALCERIKLTLEPAEALACADLVIEAVSESAKIKSAVFLQIAELAPDHAAVWSNTSSLDVFKIAPAPLQERLLIAHWFAPPHILPLVELVKGEETGQHCLDRALELLTAMGKTPVLLDRYVPGFIINRLLRALGREAFYLIDNGYITAEQLDMAVKGSLAPRMVALGIMQRYDFTGLDLSAQNFKNDTFVDAPIDLAPRTLLEHVEKGELGVKTGKGFYDYGTLSVDEASRKRDELLLTITEACKPIIMAKRGV